MSFGFRWINDQCISCLTWQEAVEIAIVNAEFSGLRHKVIGSRKDHDDKGRNISFAKMYCYEVIPEGEFIGNQRANGKAGTH